MVFSCFQEKKSNGHSGARTTYQAIRLGPLSTIVNNNDQEITGYCFCHNVPQLMVLRYYPVLKQKLVQTSDSIQTYHMMN